MRILAILSVVLSLSKIAFAQTASPEIPLAPPPEPNNGPAEIAQTYNGLNLIRDVTRPTLTVFLPSKEKATGAAVIVAPGGAFMWLSIDSEGREPAAWLIDHGIAAFVLKYRLNETPADTAAFGRAVTEHFAKVGKPGNGPNPDLPLATADGEAAVKLIRERAPEWGLDPHRIGFLGFSSGALVAVQTALADDKSARPDFVAPIYGSMNKIDVPPDAPPLFAAMAADDPIFANKGFGLIDAWIAAKRPAELHVFAKGGHGFDMDKQGFTSDHWADEFYWWMQASGFLAGSPHG